MTDALLTQIATSVWAQGSPVAQTTQQALEVWASVAGAGVGGTGFGMSTQVAIEEWGKLARTTTAAMTMLLS